MGRRQVVRQRILIPSCAGSNPAALANTCDMIYHEEKDKQYCAGFFAIYKARVKDKQYCAGFFVRDKAREMATHGAYFKYVSTEP